MTAIATPRANIKSAFETVLEAAINGLKVQKHQPRTGVKPGEIRVSVIDCCHVDFALGEKMGGEHGLLLPFITQLDCWENTPSKCEELVDKLVNAVFTSRATFKSSHGFLDVKVSRCPEPWAEEEFWRGTVEVSGEYKVSRT